MVLDLLEALVAEQDSMDLVHLVDSDSEPALEDLVVASLNNTQDNINSSLFRTVLDLSVNKTMFKLEDSLAMVHILLNSLEGFNSRCRTVLDPSVNRSMITEDILVAGREK